MVPDFRNNYGMKLFIVFLCKYIFFIIIFFLFIGFLISCCSHKLRRAATIDSSPVLKGPPCINKEDLTWVDSFSSQESALLLASVSCCRPRGAWTLGKRMGFDLDTEDEK